MTTFSLRPMVASMMSAPFMLISGTISSQPVFHTVAEAKAPAFMTCAILSQSMYSTNGAAKGRTEKYLRLIPDAYGELTSPFKDRFQKITEALSDEEKV